MHRILVEEKRWIGETRFLHALNYCMLLPGPEAHQLAVYVGWLLHRTRGGIVAGTLFVLPGLICLGVLSWIYAAFGTVGTVLQLGDTHISVQPRWFVREVPPSDAHAFGELLGESMAMRESVALIGDVVPKEMLEPVWADAAPGHARFADRQVVEQTLIDAKFRHVRTEKRKFQFQYTQEDYLTGLEIWATGRFVKEMLGDAGWPAFQERVRATFAERFSDPLNDFRDVILAIGTKN